MKSVFKWFTIVGNCGTCNFNDIVGATGDTSSLKIKYKVNKSTYIYHDLSSGGVWWRNGIGWGCLFSGYSRCILFLGACSPVVARQVANATQTSTLGCPISHGTGIVLLNKEQQV